MAKSGNNQLLGMRVKEEKLVKPVEDAGLGWAKRLYHVDCINGKVFQTFPEQDEAKKDGWLEWPLMGLSLEEIEEVRERLNPKEKKKSNVVSKGKKE